MEVQIEYSHRHIHISKEIAEQLFGPRYILNSEKKLSQGEDFAAQETLTLIGPKGKIENVRIIGPYREKTQIELLQSDAYTLGIDIPLRLSGDLTGTPGVKIVSPLNEVEINEGVIIAKRHLHTSSEDAKKNNLKDGQKIQIEIQGERSVIFKEIIVRVREDFTTRLHIDLEEANAAGVKQNDKGKIII